MFTHASSSVSVCQSCGGSRDYPRSQSTAGHHAHTLTSRGMQAMIFLSLLKFKKRDRLLFSGPKPMSLNSSTYNVLAAFDLSLLIVLLSYTCNSKDATEGLGGIREPSFCTDSGCSHLKGDIRESSELLSVLPSLRFANEREQQNERGWTEPGWQSCWD